MLCLRRPQNFEFQQFNYFCNNERDKTYHQASKPTGQKTFVAKGKSWEASDDNNDDTVSALVVFAWYISTAEFKNLYDIQIRKAIYKQSIDEICPEVNAAT